VNTSTTHRPTVLLVQGSWQQPTTWAALRAELAGRGLETRVLELPSMGEAPVAGLHEDAAAVREAIRTIDGRVVVVGHSYGGLPMTEAAAGRSDVDHLVYLSAYLLPEGESMAGWRGLPRPQDTGGWLPAQVMGDPRDVLYGDLPDAQAAEAVGQLVNQSVQACWDELAAAAWRTVPSTYVVLEGDLALPPALQEDMAANAGSVRRLPGGHTPFLSRPRALAELIDSIVAPLP